MFHQFGRLLHRNSSSSVALSRFNVRVPYTSSLPPVGPAGHFERSPSLPFGSADKSDDDGVPPEPPLTLGSRAGFAFDNSSRSWNFYYTHIRPHLLKIYGKMKAPEYRENFHLISIDDIISLYWRYPSSFWNDLGEEILQSRILVNDGDFSVFPTWFHKRQYINKSRLPLKHPLEVICTIRPTPDYHVIYSDSCPSFKKSSPGFGTLVWVNTNNEVTVLWVWLQAGTPVVTEANAVLAGVRFAVNMDLKRCIFVTDCGDVEQGLNGGSFIDGSPYDELFAEIEYTATKLQDRLYIHLHREAAGIAMCDHISRTMKNNFKPGEVVVDQRDLGWAMDLNMSDLEIQKMMADPKITTWMDKVKRGVPSVRISFLWANSGGIRKSPMRKEQVVVT